MKPFIWIFLFFAVPSQIFTQDSSKPPPPVLGTLTLESALNSSDSSWLVKGIDTYKPNAELIDDFRLQLQREDEVVIYYGSWCGDSRREVPKCIATLKSAGFSEDNITLVGVDRATDNYKQSPDGATLGAQVYRVPTISFVRNGEEIGRIIEEPKLSIERDLRVIASGKDYSPAYPVLAYVAELDRAGILDDPNVLGYSLAHSFEPLVRKSGALNSVGYVLLAEGREVAAVKILYANTRLFPDDANAFDSLAEAMDKMGRAKQAVYYQSRAIALSDREDDDMLQRYSKYQRKMELE